MMLNSRFKLQVFDEKLNRFRDVTEKERLQRELSFICQDRTDNTCNIKELKDLFENRKALNNKIKSLRKTIERKK